MPTKPGLLTPSHGISCYYDYWAEQLRDHPSVEFRNYVLSMVREGCPVGYQGAATPLHCDNWPSAYENSNGLSLYIDKHKQSGAIIGPLYNLSQTYRTSPLGAFTKKRSDKLRIIHDLSWPPGRSVNDGIDKEDYTCTYSSVSDAVALCRTMTSPWLAKTDLSDAYLQCPVKPEDTDLLGFAWESDDGRLAFFKFTTLCLGLRSAPRLFSDLAAALNYICIANGVKGHLINYLDDFLILSDTRAECEASLSVVIDCASKCGLHVKPSKTEAPCKKLTFLGLQIDVDRKTVSMSQERLSDVRQELRDWIDKKSCSKREILSLIGTLTFCSQVVHYGQLYTCRLIHASKKAKYLHYTIYLDEDCRKDIRWWLRNMQACNGISWFPVKFNAYEADIMFTDASDNAAAAVLGKNWTIQVFDGEYSWIRKKPIAFKELYAVLLGVSTFAVPLKGHQLLINIDNMAIHCCIEKGRSKDYDLNCLLRCLYFYMSVNKIHIQTCHLASCRNILADSLSRGKLDVFFAAFPAANTRMTRPCRTMTDM